MLAVYSEGNGGKTQGGRELAKERTEFPMIRLHSLTIKHFRGIREGKLEGLTDVNVLIGRNNCGKTTVIEAMMRLATAAGFQQDYLSRAVDFIWNRARQENL